ncbi:ABC transporter substrate-binding protein [Paenibacillus pasadenensis]|uniref:Iron ABC transporter substrate-binding protein n=1 Tax=Paenibacillus pasadenensis TaxID=217090 RepID=A0A2N5N250_9BACL|nr:MULTISPECIES: ABC transporter substrate-binding protein [Paenibacillus]PLT44396.1 iron ABC transporter substrate-binding protein [Paenibacillus pasadenensis]
MEWRWGKTRKGMILATALAATLTVTACGQNGGSAGEANSGSGSAQAEAGAEPSPSAPASKKLVVYSALNEDDVIQLKDQFKKDTGIEIESLNLGSAGEASTRVQAEKDAPKADILVGGSVEFYQPLAEQGLLEKYTSANASQIDAKFNDPNGYWQGWYMGVLGIVLNTERFEKELAPKGVQEPKTWDDLLDESYKRQFITSNPATAGGGYIFVADQLFRLGEQQGWEYLEKLNGNVHHYTQKAGDGINLTATGEFIAGMSWAHDIVKTMKQGYPIKAIVPEQTAFEIGGVGIVKGGANVDNAKAFVDWLLTKEAGELNTKLSNRYSVRADVAPPEGMPKIEEISLVEYDREKAAAMKEEVVKRFVGMTGTN